MTAIRAARESRCLQQSELARAANLHRSVLSKLETGADKAGPVVRSRLAEALCRPIGELFDGAGWPLEAPSHD